MSRIYLVDDHVILRDGLRAVLEAAGHTVLGESADPTTALGELLRLAIDNVMQGRRHLGPEVAELAVQALTNGGAVDLLAELSPRERQIITMVVKGASSTMIGQQLHLSPKTVDTYRSRLMHKLGVADVPALVRLAVRTGLIDAGDA